MRRHLRLALMIVLASAALAAVAPRTLQAATPDGVPLQLTGDTTSVAFELVSIPSALRTTIW